jgi:uncharacterized protein (TIGR03435 family)
MLAERFHLVAHVESQPTDVYVLEVGKKGPKLQESTEPSGPVRAVGVRQVAAKAGTMDELAFHISIWVLHRPVINQTGLKGHYKFRLEYTDVNMDAGLAVPGSPASENQVSRSNSDAQSIFSAIEQQLGLKLIGRKIPLPVVIIDHAEPPTEN